ncbi:hypothetical protein K0U00_45780, partial [Paenibacillus sepulcri]|nr:hypothetical protein [Paenibacillus sepulcri]
MGDMLCIPIGSCYNIKSQMQNSFQLSALQYRKRLTQHVWCPDGGFNVWRKPNGSLKVSFRTEGRTRQAAGGYGKAAKAAGITGKKCLK